MLSEEAGMEVSGTVRATSVSEMLMWGQPHPPAEAFAEGF